MKKNIAIIISSLNGGGAERIAGLLSKELVKYFNVYLFLLNIENIMYEYGGQIVDIGCSGPFYEYEIAANKKKYHIDYAISFLEMLNFANIRTKGTESVLVSERCVQSQIVPPFSGETLQIERYYAYADKIIACSEGVKFDLEHNYNINGNITTIYNFIDKENVILKAREKFPAEAEAFLDGAEYFLNVGRLHPQKNQKRLILQFFYFHMKYPSVKLIILGSGKLETALKSYISELGMDSFVKIVSYTKNPFKYMVRAKALILSSHYEGLPNAVLEAMTLGCPVIAVDCLAGPRELLKGEVDYEKTLRKLEVCSRGILVCDDKSEDDGTTRYMMAAMEMLYSSEHLVSTFRRNELKYMEQYTNQEILNAWLRVINECEQKKMQSVLAKEEIILETAKYIVIYGAGLVGKGVYRSLSKYYKIDCFVVSRRMEEQECMGVPVKEIVELQYPLEDTAVIIGVGYESQTDVINTLQKFGYDKIVFPYIDL